MLAKKLSKEIFHFEGIILLLFIVNKCRDKIKVNTIKEYNPKLVKLKFKYPSIGAFIPIKLVTSN